MDTEFFSKAFEGPHDEKEIIMLSRFTPEKNLEALLYAARAMRNWNFMFIGSYYKYSREVIARMNKLANMMNLKNVYVLLNAARDVILEEMRHARFILHPPFPEHFGIAVVEGMAAGLVPVVYRDGGAYYDVVKHLDPMLGYRSIEEIPRIIEFAERLWDTYSERSHRLARRFDTKEFRRHFSEIVRQVEEMKNAERPKR